MICPRPSTDWQVAEERRLKELRSVAHGDANVASELIISEALGRAIDIFVDSTSMHGFGDDIVILVISFI